MSGEGAITGEGREGRACSSDMGGTGEQMN